MTPVREEYLPVNSAARDGPHIGTSMAAFTQSIQLASRLGEEAPVVEAHVVGDDHDDRAGCVRVTAGGAGAGRGRGRPAGREHGGGPRHRTGPLQELPSA